jgi:hypothetical protein
MAAWHSAINLKAKVAPAQMVKGGMEGKDSRRVLGEGLMQEEGNRDNVDDRSYGNGIAVVLGVGS